MKTASQYNLMDIIFLTLELFSKDKMFKSRINVAGKIAHLGKGTCL